MNRICPFILISLVAITAIAQDRSVEDPFIVEKKGLFKNITVIKKSGFTLTNQQIVEFMSKDPQMADYALPLSGLFLTDVLLDAGGTILTAWPLIQLRYTKKEPNLNLTYIGLGILAGSVVIKKIFTHKAIQAVNHYNSGYQKVSSAEYSIGTTGNGIGLVINF